MKQYYYIDEDLARRDTGYKLRPCRYRDAQAYFHKWVEVEEILIKFNHLLKPDVIKEMNDSIRKSCVIPRGVSTEKIKSVKGLVEFEDGTVNLVKPELIRFTYRVESSKKSSQKGDTRG